ncbi:MAG: type II toxin-antitoxin system VapC family toxin [Proteobacteria bacterium]|nr:type II toxin-antitoxin system VapC family toxin [Pseudomonadota bacterium]
MKKLLLLDADVVIDLHTLGLFDRIIKGYEIHVTKTVLDEASYFKSGGARTKIDIRDRVTIIENVAVEHLQTVRNEAKEARLGIDPGELEAIACLIQEGEGLIFCTCDQAAIKLLSFMNFEKRSVSTEKALRTTGYQKKNLYPRHWEKTFTQCIREGKALRILFKKLTEE